MARRPIQITAPPRKNYNSDTFPLLKVMRLGELNYYAGRSDELQMRKTRDTLDILYLKIKAKITVGAAAPVGPVKAGIAGLIKRLFVKINGRDFIIDATPFSLTTLAKADYGNGLQGDTTLDLATKEYSLILPIDLRLMHSIDPSQTAIDLRVADSVTMLANFGDVNDLFATPNDAVLDVDSVVMEVFAQSTEFNRSPAGLETRLLFENRKKILVDDRDFELIEVKQQKSTSPVFTKFLRNLYIQGVNGETAASILDENQNVVVRIGSKVIVDSPLDILRANQKNHFDIAPAGTDFLHIPFYSNGVTMDCPPLTGLTGGLSVRLGVKTAVGAEISTLVEMIGRPIPA